MGLLAMSAPAARRWGVARMKPLFVFDAEAARALAYGFLAASLFGDFPFAARVLYVVCGVGAYAFARWRFAVGSEVGHDHD